MPQILVTFKNLLSASKFSHETVDFKGWGRRILKSNGLHSQRIWLSGIIIGITGNCSPNQKNQKSCIDVKIGYPGECNVKPRSRSIWKLALTMDVLACGEEFDSLCTTVSRSIWFCSKNERLMIITKICKPRLEVIPINHKKRINFFSETPGTPAKPDLWIYCHFLFILVDSWC